MSKYMTQSKKDRNGSPYQLMKDNQAEIKNLQMHLSPIQLQKRKSNIDFSAGSKHGAATLGSRIMSVDFAKGVINEKKTSAFIENDRDALQSAPKMSSVHQMAKKKIPF